MGWSAVKSQTDTFDKIRSWEQSQPGYTKPNISFIFFEFNPNGKDYGTDKYKNMELEIYEVINNEAYRRGTLYIQPSGNIINRSYFDLPDFNIQ